MKSEYYQLTDEDKEAIECHSKTFELIDSIGFDILDNTLSAEIMDDYYIPIRSLLYRLLELNDTFSVIVSNSIINTAFPIIRSEFELVVQMHYMLSNPETIENKSMLYHYCGLRSQVNDNYINSFNEQMVNSKHFSKIHAEVINIKKNDKLPWYGLYNSKHISFKTLCKGTGFSAYYERLYSHLSADIHGNSCIELNTMCFEKGGKYYLRNFRMFERHHSLMVIHMDLICRIFLSIKKCFEVSGDLIERIDDFCKKSSDYVNVYWSIKDGGLDPLPHYSF